MWLTAEGLSVLSSSKGRRGRGGEEVERTLCELCIMQIFPMDRGYPKRGFTRAKTPSMP